LDQIGDRISGFEDKIDESDHSENEKEKHNKRHGTYKTSRT
jgi:hypothetical protein